MEIIEYCVILTLEYINLNRMVSGFVYAPPVIFEIRTPVRNINLILVWSTY